LTAQALRVALVAGGPSSEAQVSRASAAGVERALRDAGHRPDLIELDRSLYGKLASGGYDVVFPAVHGRMGEDGCLQGMLEVLGLPYVGSGVLASALAMSKPHAKVHFRRAGLPVAGERIVTAGEDTRIAAAEVRRVLGTSVVVKPGAGGSALGVEMVSAEASDEELAGVLSRVLALDPVALVEEMKVGKEVTCGVLEGEDGTNPLPPTLISPKAAGWYDFRSKYGSAGSVHQCPPPFAPDLVQRIQAAAVSAHRALGCRDLSRVDFVVDDAASSFTVLEVNTLPGMTAVSLYPEEAAAAGIPFDVLCDRLVRRAFTRPRSVQVAAPDMPA
jgi:D-alanine-D-alanine ligase